MLLERRKGAVVSGDQAVSAKSGASTSPPVPVRIFVAYARADLEQLETFRSFMEPQRRDGVEFFDDRDIPPGAEWKRVLFERLESAHIIVFLLTHSFAASRFCVEKEAPRAFERRDRGECRLFAINVSHFCFEDGSQLNKIQHVPSGTPIVDMGLSAPRAWTETAKLLKDQIAEVRRKLEGAVEQPPIEAEKEEIEKEPDSSPLQSSPLTLADVGGLVRAGVAIVSVVGLAVIGLIAWKGENPSPGLKPSVTSTPTGTNSATPVAASCSASDVASAPLDGGDEVNISVRIRQGVTVTGENTFNVSGSVRKAAPTGHDYWLMIRTQVRGSKPHDYFYPQFKLTEKKGPLATELLKFGPESDPQCRRDAFVLSVDPAASADLKARVESDNPSAEPVPCCVVSNVVPVKLATADPTEQLQNR